jgi:hypothetical protein
MEGSQTKSVVLMLDFVQSVKSNVRIYKNKHTCVRDRKASYEGQKFLRDCNFSFSGSSTDFLGS